MENRKKRKKRKKKKLKLPDKILPLENMDKQFQEVWYKGRNLLNFPHSWRCVITARPSTGKSTIAKNILLRADPEFEKIYIVHVDPYTRDYEEVDGVVILEDIPPVSDPIFSEGFKTLLILDDLEYKFMAKKQLRNLDRLFSYVSSHKSVSCCIISQDAYNIPPCIRRVSNIWILGKINNDISSFLTIAQRCGMKRKDFIYVFDKYIKGDHDTLWIDRTKNTPAEYRINGYTVLDEKNNFEIKKI
jgi:hypothetical protein